jgi:Domain of unknown function (DUF4136)
MKPMRTVSPRAWIVVSAALAAVVAYAGMVAAQKIEVKTNQDPDADFSAIRTYAWLPPAPIVKNVASDAVGNPTLSQEALGPPIVAAIDKQLAARGLTPAARDTADIHVVYFAALTVGFSQTYLGEYHGYVTGWGSPIAPGLAPSTSSSVHEKGTIVIDIVQRASKRAIWRGSVVTRVHQERTLQERIARINEGTERIFKRFPIQPKK